ncbi:MAG: hypothetical protein IMF06_05095 [Proteobacteria bacterium]|nr:hypothetical protein [Pseudomonadota bacterium]
MNSRLPFSAGFLKPQLVFQLFKYTVYIFLTMNIYHFFIEDYAASSHTFAAGISLGQVIEAFTATIDTAAWVILLLLFELETYVLEDDKIKGALKWSLHLTRALCYLFIIYSFYGYLSKFFMIHTVLPFSVGDVCSLVGGSYTYIEDIDEYLPLTVDNCAAFNGMPLSRIAGTDIISTEYHLIEAQRLSMTEITNSGNWLLIVAILEMDVYLQSRGQLQGLLVTISKGIKVILYSILLLAAIYWGIKGDFLDFWDAFLWLVAFVFIEMNIFEWHQETSSNKTDEQGRGDPECA